ncbi:MAG: hypothetical protein SFU55_03830 [Methylophilus sp.]|nr:hypothetical protein [Methylophilus sp.]
MIVPITHKIKSILTPEKVEKHVLIAQQLKNLAAKEAVSMSVQMLSALGEDQKLEPLAQLKCLYAIDELVRDHIDQILAKRLKVKMYNRDVGVAIDALVYPYFRRLFLEYMRCVEWLSSTNTRLSLKNEEQALLLCRAINATLNMMMWRYFDDQPAPAEAWSKAHYLFKIAEKSSLLRERVILYPQDKSATDFASLYAGGLMLGTLKNGNYQAAEFHLTAKLLFDWIREAHLEKAYASDKHQFFVNLNQDKGIERIRGFDKAADYRYLKTQHLVVQIEQLLHEIHTGTLSTEHVVRSYGSIRVMSKLLKKLNQDWSPTLYKRQRRTADRIKQQTRIVVTNGLAQICKQLSLDHDQSGAADKQYVDKRYYDIKASTYQELSLTQTRNVLMGVDEWALLEVSETGFSADIGTTPSAWVEVGKLVGCHHPIHRSYVVAEIKSLKRLKNGAYRVGLQIISLHSLCLELIKQDLSQVELSKGFYLDNMGDDADLSKVNCVWIPANDASQRIQSSVIIPFAEYKRNREFKIEVNGEDRTLVLGRALDMHAEWVRATIASIQ